MSNETIQIDLADDDACLLIEQYIATNFSDPSVKLFEDLQEDFNYADVDQFFRAAGKAVLNEALNKILAEEVARKTVELIDERENNDSE